MESAFKDVRLADAFYAVMRIISNDNWNQFARIHLRLEDFEIDNIIHDHDRNVQDRQYSMLKRWKEKLGEKASVDELNRCLKNFSPNADLAQEIGKLPEASFEQHDAATGIQRVVLFFHRQILPQAKLTEESLSKKNFVVTLHCCDEDDIDCGLEENAIRIFIITGRFITENGDQYADILKCSPVDSTLLITRKRNLSYLEEFPHFKTATVKKSLTADEFEKIITEFMKNRKFQRLRNEVGEQGFLGVTTEDSTLKDCDPQLVEKYENEMKKIDFLDGKVNGKLSYILITSPHKHDDDDALASIVTIPWIRVFDFDPQSRVTGLLSRVEKQLEQYRYFTTSDSKDKIEAIDDRATNWVFINGYRDTVAGKTDVCELCPNYVFRQCDSLISFCKGRKVPAVLVLWYPPNNRHDKNLEEFFVALRYHLLAQNVSFKCVICMAKRPDKKSTLGHMLKMCKMEENVIVVPFTYLCRWLTKIRKLNVSHGKCKILPQFSEINGEKGTFNISDSDFKWLGLCFEVLDSNDDLWDESKIVAEGEDFLKGGKLSWDAIASEKYDAKRDILNSTKSKVIKQYIQKGKSGIVTIFHPPGGGGTTFARRLLWELRKESPCMELHTMDVAIEEVKNRLGFIRNEAHLPAVVLIDGNSAHDVKTLLECCRYEKLVILHVQRFYSSFKNAKTQSEVVWLSENVSLSEGNKLLGVFSNIKPERKNALVKLTDDVKRGENRCMFEYGLTTFDAEFRGLKRYVHGNLQIGEKTELENWHKVLAYLALANYYGHIELPSKLFGKLLSKEEDEVVNLGDIPYSAQKFVNEGECGEWSITYFIVAKEILEQVLVKRSCPMYNGNSKYLSESAKGELCKLAIHFIHFIQDNISSTTHIPSHIQDILTRIFIERNYKDAGENDEFEKKSKFSRLVADTGNDADKKSVLLELVKCFPMNAEFHAHLGRFHGIAKNFQEAENCLKKAVEVRTTQLEILARTSPQRGDEVLHRVYSMFGFYLNKLVKDEIYCCKPSGQSKIVQKVLEKARECVEKFRMGRHYFKIGCNPSYVLLGEIKVRLQLANFAHTLSHNNIAILREWREPYSQLYEFVIESFVHCDQLLVQCMHEAEDHHIPRQEFNKCINQFIMFYNNAHMALKSYVRKDKSIYSKTCNISMIKMGLTKEQDVGKFQMYEQVREIKDLKQIIRLYNDVFKDVGRHQLHFYISNYMMEWLQAIRHPLLEMEDVNKYMLAEVRSKVEQWDARNERRSLSKFYNYVLTTLLAINAPRGEVSNTYSEQACKLKGEMNGLMIPQYYMDRSIEWLAKHDNSQSFRNLLHRNLLGEWDETFFKNPVTNLRVCKGKIFKCKIWYGHIVLDGDHQPQITVYFNPQRYKLSGSAEKQKTRVEFYIGFNPNHGAEAYEVKVLNKFSCPKCSTQTEVSTLGKERKNHFGNCPNCNEIVYLPNSA